MSVFGNEDAPVENMTEAELESLISSLDAVWDRLDRKSDPRGEYQSRQDAIAVRIAEARAEIARRASNPEKS